MSTYDTTIPGPVLARDESRTLFGQTMGLVAVTAGLFALGAHLAGAFFVPAETFHGVKNVGTGTATELATYVLEKGKPLFVLDE